MCICECVGGYIYTKIYNVGIKNIMSGREQKKYPLGIYMLMYQYV